MRVAPCGCELDAMHLCAEAMRLFVALSRAGGQAREAALDQYMQHFRAAAAVARS